MNTTALAKLAALTLLTLSSASLVACGGDTPEAKTGRAGMALKKRADGKPTGDGVSCSWSGVSPPGAAPGGAPDAPIASPPSGPAGSDPVASTSSPSQSPEQPVASPPHAGTGSEPGVISPPNPGSDSDFPGATGTEPPGGYGVGAPVPSPDGCNTCTCTEEGIACTMMACAEPPPPVPPPPGGACELDGITHAVGDSFPSPDGCNSCSCTEQGIACTAMACIDQPHSAAE